MAASLSKLKQNKTTDPDGLKACLLKDCALQLKAVFTRLFQLLLDSYAQCQNHGDYSPNYFRLIAITSILCKTMELVLASHLTTTVVTKLDPLQFICKSNRGTDDAVLTLLNAVTLKAMPEFYLWTFGQLLIP